MHVARRVTRSTRFAATAMLAGAAMFMLAGCENKVTVANYDQITNGMTVAQVEKILGGSGKDDTSHAGVSISGGGVGSSSAAAEKTYVWSHQNLTVQVVFKDGKVVQKTKTGS